MSGSWKWLKLEQEECLPYDIGAVGLSPLSLKKSTYGGNFIIHNTQRIWKQIKAHFGVKTLSFLLPIAANLSFSPSVLDGGFKQWRGLRIRTIGDLYLNGTFASFEQLQEKYGLHRSNFFRFLQVRSYVLTHSYGFAAAQPSCMDDCLRDLAGKDKIISRLYDTLQSINPPTTTSIRADWEKELG